MKIEYRLLEEESVGKLSKSVSMMMDEGWSLYKNPFYAPLGGAPYYCQALTKAVEKQ